MLGSATTPPRRCNDFAQLHRARSTSPSRAATCGFAAFARTRALCRWPNAARFAGLPVTSPARALLEIAPQLAPRRLRGGRRAGADQATHDAARHRGHDRAGGWPGGRPCAARGHRGACVHALVGGAAGRRAHAGGAAPATAVQRQGGGMGGRRPLAPRAGRARVRLLRLSRDERRLQARPPQDRRASAGALRRAEDDVARAHEGVARARRADRGDARPVADGCEPSARRTSSRARGGPSRRACERRCVRACARSRR